MKRNSSTPKAPGQRQLRVAERIRHLLAQVLREASFHDPALGQANLISVSAVDIGPDLKHATAYIMPLGGKNAAAVLEGMNRAAGFFRASIASDLDLRYTPKISFRLDNSFEESDRINRLLNQEQVQKDLKSPPAETPDSDDE